MSTPVPISECAMGLSIHVSKSSCEKRPYSLHKQLPSHEDNSSTPWQVKCVGCVAFIIVILLPLLIQWHQKIYFYITLLIYFAIREQYFFSCPRVLILWYSVKVICFQKSSQSEARLLLPIIWALPQTPVGGFLNTPAATHVCRLASRQ
jgi:hypothetical protein